MTIETLESGSSNLAATSLARRLVDKLQAARSEMLRHYTPSTRGIVPAVTNESSTQLWDRLEENWRYLATQCVQESSAETYTTGWKHFLRMCTSLKCDPLLRVPFAGYSDGGHNLDYPTVMILNYIAFLQSPECAGDDLQLSTMQGYLSAVHHYLRIHLAPVATCFNDPLVKQARSSLKIVQVERRLEEVTTRLACTVDLILFGKMQVLDATHDLHDEVTVLTMEIQYTCLNRVGELLSTADDHYMRADDILFELEVFGETRHIHPGVTHRYAISQMHAMILTTRSAKNDQVGAGSRLYLEVQDTTSADIAFCVATDAFRWSQKARPHGDESFLSYQNKWMLEPDSYNRAIQRVAHRMGLDHRRFTSHSLRIGGASALAAAGMPDWFIKKMGRWKSLAFLQYIQFAKSSMRVAFKVLLSPTFSPSPI